MKTGQLLRDGYRQMVGCGGLALVTLLCSCGFEDPGSEQLAMASSTDPEDVCLGRNDGGEKFGSVTVVGDFDCDGWSRIPIPVARRGLCHGSFVPKMGWGQMNNTTILAVPSQWPTSMVMDMMTWQWVPPERTRLERRARVTSLYFQETAMVSVLNTAFTTKP